MDRRVSIVVVGVVIRELRDRVAGDVSGAGKRRGCLQ